MKRTYKLYLNDILEAIERIEQYTRGLSFKDFSTNSMRIDAVVRNFEIIGEAAKQIPIEIKEKQDQIPWKEMAGTRDKLTHDYSGINNEILWQTAKKRLPILKPLIENLIEKADKPSIPS
jgi:uncharacterized protein with HEPN domain